MESIELWTQIEVIFSTIVKYGFPTIAILLSILSFIDSRKANKIRDRLNEIEESLKKYELEEKEKEREEAGKACVEARIMNISKGNYRLKIWNSGKATAYNVNFDTPSEGKPYIYRDKVPFEFLEAGKSFEEVILVHFGTPDKFKFITTWEDERGIKHSKENLLTV